MQDSAWLNAMAEVDEMLESGIPPSELLMSIQSYGTYEGCEVFDTLTPTGDVSYSNGVSWSGGSPVGGTGWDKIDDGVDTTIVNPVTTDYIRYNYGYPGSDPLIVSDVFEAGPLPSWPSSAKLRICCADFSGGGSSGQWNRCSLKSADNKLIGMTALGDLPGISGTTPYVIEMDLELEDYDPTADLSSTQIQLRLSNGNVCDVRVYAAEVVYGVPCPCETEVTLRPDGRLGKVGFLGDIVGTGTRWEILSENNFTDTSYDNYLKVVEDIGEEPYEVADEYSIGGIGGWPTSATVRIRSNNVVFPISAAVTNIWIYDSTFNNELASWGPGFNSVPYSLSPITQDYELTINPYDPDVDLGNLILSVRYQFSSGIINESDFRIYAYAVDFEVDCPDEFVGTGGFVVGGSSLLTFDHVPSVSGGYTIGGEALVLSGLIGSGGLLAGGSATVTASYETTGSGGVSFGGFPYRYRRTITVPAGKVTTDLDGFVLGVIAEIDPAKAGSNWLFTSSTLQTLPHEIREYASGKLTAYVRTPLKAAEDTLIYLYYGAP